MGACTASIKATIPTLDHEIVVAEVTFSSSYATSGDSVAASIFGLAHVDYCVVGGCDDAKYHAFYDTAAKTMILYVEDGTSGIEAQVANTTDVDAIRVGVIAVGKGA